MRLKLMWDDYKSKKLKQWRKHEQVPYNEDPGNNPLENEQKKSDKFSNIRY